MLNTFNIGGNTTKVSFTTPSMGIIQKSHPKSRFLNMQNTSSLAEKLFNHDKPPYLGKNMIPTTRK